MTKRNKIVLAALAVVFAIAGPRLALGVTQSSSWWTHFTFHFVHGNVFHLAANLFATFCLLRCKHNHWLSASVIATAVSFLYFFPQPLVGFSGIIMADYGTLLPYYWHRKSVRRSMAVLLVLSVISLFFNQLPAILFHAACLLLGVAFTHLSNLIHDFKNEYSRDKTRADRA